MNKAIAKQLHQDALRVAGVLSRPNRDKNFKNEVFMLNRIVPLSEYTAAVIYDKNTGKRALVFFIWLQYRTKDDQPWVLGHWHNIVVKTDHILGFRGVEAIYREVEAYNYEHNFPKDEEPDVPGPDGDDDPWDSTVEQEPVQDRQGEALP